MHGLPGNDNLFLLARHTRRANGLRHESIKTQLREAHTDYRQSFWLAWNWPDYRNALAYERYRLRLR